MQLKSIDIDVYGFGYMLTVQHFYTAAYTKHTFSAEDGVFSTFCFGSKFNFESLRQKENHIFLTTQSDTSNAFCNKK